MALTKTPIELSSTPSIVDGGNATAITIDSSENVTFAGEISTAGVNTITSNTPKITFIESDQSNKQYQIGSFGAAYAIYDASNSQYRYTLTTSGDHIFNEGGVDCDFRVESNGSTHMLFVDGGNNRVGINTADPATTLEVGGVITIKGTTGSDGINFESNNQRIYHGGHRLLEGSTSTTGTIGLGESYTGDISIQPRIKAHRGIVFGSDTATANTLDDYEEGTWDPDWTTTGTDFDQSGTSNSTGYYTKIGNTVMVTFGCVLAGTVSGGTGNVNITGLPFTAERASYGTFAPGRITLTYDSYYTSIPEGTSNVNVVGIRSANTGVQLLASEVNGNGTPFFSSTIVYRTTA